MPEEEQPTAVEATATPEAAPDVPVTDNESALDSIKAIRAGRDENADVDYGDDPEPEVDAGETEPAEAPEESDPDEVGEPGGKLESALELLEQDDIEGALREAFGDKLTADKLKEKLGVHPARFAALREQKKKMEEAFSQKERDFTEKARSIVQQLTPANEFHKALGSYKETGDTDSVVKAIEKATGEEFTLFLKKFTAGEKSRPAPRTSRELEELRREIAELKKAREPQTDPKQQYQEQLQRFHQQLESELSSHDVAKLPKWQDKVTAVMRRHYDQQLGASRVSPKRAAKMVVDQAIKEAEALGLSKAEAKRQVEGKRRQKPTTRTAAEETGTDSAVDDEDAMQSVLRMRRARRMRGGGE